MRLRLFTFLVAFAVLWSGAGGSALACAVESPASVFLTVDASHELAPTGDDDKERKSSPAGQAVPIITVARQRLLLRHPWLLSCL